MRKLGGVALTAAIVTLLVGCGSRDTDLEAAGTPEPKPLPAKCLTATAGAISALQDDVADTVPVDEFTGSGVIKSESGDDVWFIALAWRGDGTTYTGTWGTAQDPTVDDEIAYIAADDVAALTSTHMQPASFEGFTSTLIGADDCIR